MDTSEVHVSTLAYQMMLGNTTFVPENFNTTTDISNMSVPGLSPEEHISLQMYKIFVPLIWGILTLVGAFGNALVIYTLIRHGDKNATNYFVINLAVSDFAFVVIVVPFTATLYVLPEWVFGNVMCKITMYMIYVSTLNVVCLRGILPLEICVITSE